MSVEMSTDISDSTIHTKYMGLYDLLVPVHVLNSTACNYYNAFVHICYIM